MLLNHSKYHNLDITKSYPSDFVTIQQIDGLNFL